MKKLIANVLSLSILFTSSASWAENTISYVISPNLPGAQNSYTKPTLSADGKKGTVAQYAQSVQALSANPSASASLTGVGAVHTAALIASIPASAPATPAGTPLTNYQIFTPQASNSVPLTSWLGIGESGYLGLKTLQPQKTPADDSTLKNAQVNGQLVGDLTRCTESKVETWAKTQSDCAKGKNLFTLDATRRLIRSGKFTDEDAKAAAKNTLGDKFNKNHTYEVDYGDDGKVKSVKDMADATRSRIYNGDGTLLSIQDGTTVYHVAKDADWTALKGKVPQATIDAWKAQGNVFFDGTNGTGSTNAITADDTWKDTPLTKTVTQLGVKDGTANVLPNGTTALTYQDGGKTYVLDNSGHAFEVDPNGYVNLQPDPNVPAQSFYTADNKVLYLDKDKNVWESDVKADDPDKMIKGTEKMLEAPVVTPPTPQTPATPIVPGIGHLQTDPKTGTQTWVDVDGTKTVATPIKDNPNLLDIKGGSMQVPTGAWLTGQPATYTLPDRQIKADGTPYSGQFTSIDNQGNTITKNYTNGDDGTFVSTTKKDANGLTMQDGDGNNLQFTQQQNGTFTAQWSDGVHYTKLYPNGAPMPGTTIPVPQSDGTVVPQPTQTPPTLITITNSPNTIGNVSFLYNGQMIDGTLERIPGNQGTITIVKSGSHIFQFSGYNPIPHSASSVVDVTSKLQKGGN